MVKILALLFCLQPFEDTSLAFDLVNAVLKPYITVDTVAGELVASRRMPCRCNSSRICLSVTCSPGLARASATCRIEATRFAVVSRTTSAPALSLLRGGGSSLKRVRCRLASSLYIEATYFSCSPSQMRATEISSKDCWLKCMRRTRSSLRRTELASSALSRDARHCLIGVESSIGSYTRIQTGVCQLRAADGSVYLGLKIEVNNLTFIGIL